jgi:hypothetical protein
MMNPLSKPARSLLMVGIAGILTGCPGQTAPPLNVTPIPRPPQPSLQPTPVPSSSIVVPTPLPSGQNPGEPGVPPLPTPTPPLQPGQLGITTSTLDTAVLNFSYLFPLQATGGSGSYRWNLVSGLLPNGLSLDQATGQIFGKPTQTGTYSFEIQVTDTNANVARRSFFVLVSDTDVGVNTIRVLTDSLNNGTVNRRFSQTLQASGGVTPFTWRIQSGALPDGLDLNSTTGEISGTPTLSGDETFTVQITDARGQTATRSLSMTINSTDSDISILTSALPNAVVGRPLTRQVCGLSFSGQIQATGGKPPYNWSVSNGSLPTGLSLNSSTGEITGNPSSAGSQTFTVRVRDSESNASTRVFSLQSDSLLVHSFTPNAGGEGQVLTVYGENLGTGNSISLPTAANNSQQVTSAYSSGVTTASFSGDTATCQQVTATQPAGAASGFLGISNGSNLIGTSTFPFIVTDVVINEVFFSPDSSESQFVELKNYGPHSVNVAGWHLRYTNVDGTLEDFTIPVGTLLLAPQQTLVINIARDGSNGASVVHTGTGLKEMRLDPATGPTEIALCRNSSCTDATLFRDYILVNDGTNTGATLNTLAGNAGVWDGGGTGVNVQTLRTSIDNTALDISPADTSTAHFGVTDASANGLAGLQLIGSDAVDKFMNYTGQVIVDAVHPTNPKLIRIKRTVTGLNTTATPNRVLLNSSLFETNISASNVGTGAVGNGIQVDNVDLLNPLDLVNVVSGNIVRGVAGVSPIGDGPAGRIELNSVVFAPVRTDNDDDGTTTGLAIDGASLLGAATSLSITVRDGLSGRFTVVRQPISIDASSTPNRVVLDSPLATMTIPTTNVGDGTTGSGIQVSATTNFLTGNKVKLSQNGELRQIVISGGRIELRDEATGTIPEPIAQTVVSTLNSGTGAAGSLLAVDSVAEFAVGNKVNINGVVATINGVQTTPNPALQITPAISMVIGANTSGDGSAGNGVPVGTTTGFANGNMVRFANLPGTIAERDRQITLVPGSPNRIEFTPIGTTVNAANSGDGSTLANCLTVADGSKFPLNSTIRFVDLGLTRTVAEKSGANCLRLNQATFAATPTTTVNGAVTASTSVVVVDSSLLPATPFRVRFGNGTLAQVTNVDVGTHTLTVSPAVTLPNGTALNPLLTSGDVNLVPTAAIAGSVVLNAGGLAAANVNLVPIAGSMSLVPTSFGGTDVDKISIVPKTGKIYFAPRQGTVSKYQSIKYLGTGNGITNYDLGAQPNGTTLSAPTRGN